MLISLMSSSHCSTGKRSSKNQPCALTLWWSFINALLTIPRPPTVQCLQTYIIANLKTACLMIWTRIAVHIWWVFIYVGPRTLEGAPHPSLAFYLDLHGSNTLDCEPSERLRKWWRWHLDETMWTISSAKSRYELLKTHKWTHSSPDFACA